MRTAGASITLQQTLTSEAASVLKHSLALARRRGHAQVTPLHVAATLLSTPKSSLLKAACFFKTQPQISPHHHHPLQSRALELCFNVALNRLPTTPSPLLHNQPSLSNALIAALKRAQAHQRRGCIEQQQQQQPLLAVKVELEQLVLSILDDPSVSRVMREAGFSSTAVKSNIEENFSSSPSSVFQCYSSNGGVYSTPPSPPDRTQNLNRGNFNYWQNPFWNQRFEQNPFLFSPQKKSPITTNTNSEDVKLVLEVFLKKKRRNTVIVGDSVSVTEDLVLEIMDRIERGDVPEDLKNTHFIKFQFSSVPLKFMKRDEVEMNVTELRRKVDSCLARGKGVIIYTGDLKWTVDDREKEYGGGVIGYDPVDHLVADIGKLMNDYNNSSSNTKSGRVWLMGIANYQSYMRCQMKQPSLEVQWCLQAVSVPSGGLGLSLDATSVQDPKISFSPKPGQVVAETKPFRNKDEQCDKLTCCDECTSKYEKEAATFIKSGLIKDLDKSSCHLPFWLQSNSKDMLMDDLVELRRKWNRLCQNQHQGISIQNDAGSFLFNNQSLSNKSNLYPSWPNPNTLLSDSNSISFIHTNTKPIHTSSFPRFRRQQSCHIDFSFSNESHQNQALEPNLDSLKTTEGKEVKITLALGNSQFSNAEKPVEKENKICRKLKENVPWQAETISLVVEALVEESKSGKNKTWFLIEGDDYIGKRRLARGISEAVFGSVDFFIHMNMKETENKRKLNCEILENSIRDHNNLVVLVENADFADAQFLKFLSDAFEDGKCGNTNRNKGKSGKVIFILTKDDSQSYGNDKDLNSIIQMKLEVSEINLDLGNKRKAEWNSPKKAKSPRINGNEKAISTEIMNTLDLNIKAEDEDGESKMKAEILKIPLEFLELSKNRFTFTRDSTQDSLIKDRILSKIKGSFEEVCTSEGNTELEFGVENKLLEEFLVCAGYFLESQLEKWLKQVFETSLKTVNNKWGKVGGNISVRLCLDTEEGTELESSWYMCSCLPKKIQVSFMG